MVNDNNKKQKANKLIAYKRGGEMRRDFTADISAIDDGAFTDGNARREAAPESGSYILAVCNSRIIGYLCYRFKGNEVFADSIAVSPEFGRRGVGRNLFYRLFAFLAKEAQSGKQIKSVCAYAYTAEGAALLRSLDFAARENGRGEAPLMCFALDDFSETNMYLFVPFFVNGEIDTSEALISEEEGGNLYLKQLNYISKREFGDLSDNIKRGFIGREKFIIADEKGEKALCGDKECKIYLTAYKNFYAATIAFTGLGYEPAALIHQAAGNALYINLNGEKLHFNAYLAKRFNLELSCASKCADMTGRARCFRQAYDAKCFTSLTVKPQESHLAHMLACDCYGTGGMDETVTSPVFFEKARRNLEEHQFTQIYASEKSVVFVLTDSEKNRLLHESRMIFVMELLSLQICAFSSNYGEVVNGLDKREFSRKTIDGVNFRYSRAAKLWDLNNFRFLPAKNVFGALTAEFNIPKLKEELNENLNTFEKMTAMDLQKKVERHSKALRTLLTFFSLVAGISGLSSLTGLFYRAFNENSGEAVTALIICAFSVTLFTAFAVFYIVCRKKYAAGETDAKCGSAHRNRGSTKHF